MPQISFPSAERVKCDAVEMHIVENFLNKKECADLITLIKQNLQPSKITTSTKEPNKNLRISQTSHLNSDDDPIIKDLDQKISSILGINLAYSETTQGQYYQKGGHFKPHTDYFNASADVHQKMLAEQGQRTWTFMIYLNEPKAGGVTVFPVLNKSFSPRLGMALFWNNLDSEGNENEATLHHATPVIEGEKFIITKWFRSLSEGGIL